MSHLSHLEPVEAVAEAQRMAVDREDRAWAVDQLDKYLRVRLVAYLQNRQGERAMLSKALIAARTWAVREEMETHKDRWSLLLGVLADSRHIPSRAEQVDLLTDRESSILAALVLGSPESSDLRPKTLASDLGMSEQNVNNYLKRMEKAGLVVRHRALGQRAVLVFPTRKGIDLAKQLGLTSNRPDQGGRDHRAGVEMAAEVPLWHLHPS